MVVRVAIGFGPTCGFVVLPVAVRAPGSYRIRVDGQASHPFPIAAGIFTPLKFAALNYFYQTRAGIPIEARYAGGTQWARAAGHQGDS